MNLSKHPLIQPHLGKVLILDSNLLLLLWGSRLDPSLIHRFKRLSAFEKEDAAGLELVVTLFPAVRTTAHVLTEVSNLANGLPSWRKADWAENFKQHVSVLEEIHLPASQIITSELLWLGLTDAALIELAGSHTILTVDFPLSNFLAQRGLPGINFTYLRSLWLQ